MCVLLIGLFYEQYASCVNQELNNMLGRVVDALNIVLEQKFNQKDKKLLYNIEQQRKELLLKKNEKIGKTSVASTTKIQSLPGYPWGQILFSLVKTFNPQVVLELGTCIGISGSYFLAGLESNNKGRLYTIETFEDFLPFIQKYFQALGYSRYSILLGNLKEKFKKNLPDLYPIDIVFDDHIHERDAVLKNFDQIYAYLADQSLYIFDDILINDSMTEAWKILQQDKRINITFSLTLGLAYPHRPYRGCMPRIGIGIILKKSNLKKHFDIKIDNLVDKRLVIRHGELVVTS